MVFVTVFPLIPPGLIVQLTAGSPDRTTLPAAVAHVGCVIVPTVGAAISDWELMATLPDATEVHPASLVTVKLYVPAASPEMVVVAVLSETEPGLIVQFPAGNPESETLPVEDAHVGCVMVTTTGA